MSYNNYQQNPYSQHQNPNDNYGPSNYQDQQGGRGYEMTPLNQQPFQQATNPQAFFSEIGELRQLNNDINAKITEIENLQHESLSQVDEYSISQTAGSVDAVAAEISSMNRSLADRIRTLKSKTVNDADKASQVTVLQRTFEKTINRYQQVEVAHQKKTREQIARQYRIANPTATEDDIREIQEGDANPQIFSQATMAGQRSGAARSALAEVRSRHNDIQKIERTMVELAQLFEHMNQLVVEQGEVVNQIEDHGNKVEEDTGTAVKELDTAIKSAAGARRKKWWCLLLVLIIIIIVVIIVVVVTKPWQK
ncbi:Plasma membrane t-SNARE, secretory vesicle fusion [Orbilia brochopaga]|uniref:Plasma membrane t-SNARE, secretory vesicle fusion n=1 Tax=Orbilia brochopaga TaxID=3140254 RepID=A0AAV9UI82_9PEZI